MNQQTQLREHLSPETLNAFVDYELALTEQQGIEQHLSGCHACTLRVLSATQLKRATASVGHRFVPTAEAFVRLTTQLHSQTPQQEEKKVACYPCRLRALKSGRLLLPLSC